MSVFLIQRAVGTSGPIETIDATSESMSAALSRMCATALADVAEQAEIHEDDGSTITLTIAGPLATVSARRDSDPDHALVLRYQVVTAGPL